jgi:AI-2 transport protein TqsA
MLTGDKKFFANENQIIIALLAVICIVCIGFILSAAKSIVLPLAFAVFLNYILSPLIGLFERLKIPGVISSLLAILTTFLAMFFLGIMISNSIENFAEALPKYQARINAITLNTLKILNIPPEVFNSATGWTNDPKISAVLGDFSITGIISSILGSVTTFLSNLFLVLLFLLFILMGRNQLVKKLGHAFEPEMSKKVSGIILNINKEIQKYLIAKTLISLATALLAMLVLSLFGVQFVLIWGILTFLLNFIPNIGSVIATILPLAIAFIQFDKPIMVLWIALCLISIQMLIGNIVDPKVVGRSLNLSPIVVLFSLMFWGWLWGIIGMFLSVPIAVMIKIIFENIKQLRFASVLMSDNR